jgi:hypothetical protein
LKTLKKCTCEQYRDNNDPECGLHRHRLLQGN